MTDGEGGLIEIVALPLGLSDQMKKRTSNGMGGILIFRWLRLFDFPQFLIFSALSFFFFIIFDFFHLHLVLFVLSVHYLIFYGSLLTSLVILVLVLLVIFLPLLVIVRVLLPRQERVEAMIHVWMD